MPLYSVSLPITGYVVLDVEADSEDAAIDRAFEQEITNDHIEEWQVHQQIVTGNVFHGTMNEATAELAE
jgi:hypothetical protein